MIPITTPTLPEIEKLTAKFEEIFASGQLTNGKYVEEFETACAEYVGAKYAVAVSSCTVGLILTHKCMDLIGEVILPSFTFSATAHSLVWNNLTPVFVDCGEATHNIDPDLIEEKITSKTSAILAVDIFGNPCDRVKIEHIAKKHKLSFIVDSAHGLGSLYDGKKIGNWADAHVFSLSPTKVVVAGEGGIIATNNENLASKLKKARNYGDPGDYNCDIVGLNGRMAETNAIIGNESLKMVESNVSKRNKLANRYIGKLSIEGIEFQRIAANSRSTYKDFSMTINESILKVSRDDLIKKLQEKGVNTRPYYDPPIHKMDAYKKYHKEYENKLPVTAKLAKQSLSIPMFSHMTEEQQDFVVDAIKSSIV